ncbi:hypothetical protein GHJ49_00385 [Alistipes sp. dk3620]|jgi:hypothetical protein|uniref:hypothetical protein n=1 Tax=unclassified Alistipes TaxID=2608932 RepID=UPI001297EDD5|nr:MULTISPECIES: hypothetical protein [unclassified Alistipes]MQX26110.1 hypothetical protein [Alistipes sp. dk3620]QGA23552.1 hypothetical protein GFH31_06760 [Alistipes sp. dk3624]DAE71490.1 MAG TPA: hypothetical protein [Caudoviricetes sp.]
MKKLLLLTIISVVNSLSAQRIAVNEIDKFTGAKIVETSTLLTKAPDVTFKLRRVNDSLSMRIFIEKIKRVEIKDSSASIILLVKDGDKIGLQGKIEYLSSKERNHSIHWGAGISTGGAIKVSSVTIDVYIPDDVFATLCDNDLTDIRITVNGANIDRSLVSYSYSKKLRKMFNLMNYN